jgi:hypothetical protein
MFDLSPLCTQKLTWTIRVGKPAPGPFLCAQLAKSRQGFPRRLMPLRCACVEVSRAKRRSNVA